MINQPNAVVRSRWAAFGAAIAVSLGAGGIGVGIGQANGEAASPAGATFYAIEPCRLANELALTADSTVTLDGEGPVGACDLPDDVVAIATNVTAVGATEQTNLRFFPGSSERPETASLNPSPGAPPTPNAVTIPLDPATGEFQVYNRFGTVQIYIDVVGFYRGHAHDDRYYTEDEIDRALADKADLDEIYTRAEADERFGDTTDVDRSLINIYDLVPLQPYPSAGPVDPPSWYLEGAWAHEGTADEECLYGAIALAPGTPANGATVVYSAGDAGTVFVELFSMPNDTTANGAIPVQDLTGAAAYPASGLTARSEITIDFAEPDVILDGHNYLVLVCTADDFGLFGLEINTG